MPESNPFARWLRLPGGAKSSDEASPRTRGDVERELAAARSELVREWPTDQPTFALKKAPSKAARAALQRVIRLQNELDSLPKE